MGNMCGRSDTPLEQTTVTVGKNYREISSMFSGEGVKRTAAWEAEITRSELSLERERFWGTRSSGSRRIWLMLRQAVEADHLSAAMMLQMASVTALNGSMSICVDANGSNYEIPPFVINDPVQFPEDKQHTKKKKRDPAEPPKEIEVKLRNSATSKDKAVTISNDMTAKNLKDAFVAGDSIDPTHLRLFFGGKELKEADILSSFGLKQGMVVQVMLPKK